MAQKFRKFNFAQNLSYVDPKVKDEWHRAAKAALAAFADLMGLTPKDYDLRSNKAGIAVGGEVTLHTDIAYIQVSVDLDFVGGILYRRCNGRRDFTGERNHWESISLLNNPDKMKEKIGWVLK